MDQYQETFDSWNKVASIYEEKFMDLDLYDETYDLICSGIEKENASLLEIGCGPGNITKYLLNKRPDFQIHGIDIAPNMIKLAKKNNPTANFSVMDSRKIDTLETKFDGIICGFCLPYLSTVESLKLISDSSKLLTDNGLIYISFMEGDPSQSGFQFSSNGYRSYFYYHRLNELEKQLKAKDFEQLKVFKVEYKKSATAKEMHTIVIARKRKQ